MIDDIVVGKFGGGSFLQPDGHERFARIMTDDPRRQVFVFSALGSAKKEDGKNKEDEENKKDRVTQLLVALAGLRGRDDESSVLERAKIIDRLVVKHEEAHQVQGGYVGDTVRRHAANDTLSPAAYKADLKALGEYLNTKLIAEKHGLEFVDAREVIRLTGGYDNGKVDPETYRLIAQRLKPGGRYALPGFYGLLPNGELATMAFGGSDTTGAVVARGKKARFYENWTESSVLAAHPDVVPSARKIDVVTRREMRILSYSGMEIIHPEAFKPLEGTPIALHIRDLKAYPAEGTYVVEERIHDPARPVVGVGYRRLVAFSVDALGLNDRPGVVRQMLEALQYDTMEGADRDLQFLFTGVDDVAFVFRKEDVGGVNTPSLLEAGLRDIAGSGHDGAYAPNSVTFYDAFECVVVAGKGMTQKTHADILLALDRANIEVEAHQKGPHSPCLVMAVGDGKGEAAVNVIYNAFLK